MRKIVNHHQSGFTLIELLIYLAGVGIITVVIVGIFISFGRVRGQSVARAEVSSNLRLVMSQLTQDIRQAIAVTSPDPEGEVGEEKNALTLARSGDYLTYCLSSTGALNRYVSDDAPAEGECASSGSPLTSDQVIIDDATDGLIFTLSQNTNDDLGVTISSITIKITISYNSLDPNFAYTASEQTTVSLR